MIARRLVLIVDDDEDIRAVVADVLEAEGFAVATAANGLHGLRLLRDGTRPDVILLDLMMPEMDGWAFRSEQLNDPRIAEIPVVVFTAYGAGCETAAKLSANGCLTKPPHIDELVRVLSSAAAPGAEGEP